MKYLIFIILLSSCVFKPQMDNNKEWPLCNCFNCTNHRSGVIPVLTMEQLDFNIHKYITNISKEKSICKGDIIALRNWSDSTMSIIFYHPNYPRKVYQDWYIYRIK